VSVIGARSGTTFAEPDWQAELYSEALRRGRGPLFLRRPDGWMLPLDIERWCGGVDEADRSVLKRCVGPVLDVGCGPGRFVSALADQRHPVLGIDISVAAVERTRRGGGAALCRSVYDTLPAEGRWRTALLMDGNLGIGGDPTALLRRLTKVLAPGGLLLAEVVPADVDERITVQVEDDRGRCGGLFAWARLGNDALARHADAGGWRIEEQWLSGDRRFSALRAPG
jgi:SAM-dependent methyltransferase